MRSNQDRTILALWLLCRASLVMYLIGIIVTIIIYTVSKIYNGDNDPSESFDYALLIALMPFTVIPINTLILGICYFTGACRSVVFKLSQTIIESVMFFIIFIEAISGAYYLVDIATDEFKKNPFKSDNEYETDKKDDEIYEALH